MPANARSFSSFSYRLIVIGIMIAGALGSLVSYGVGRAAEREQAIAEFESRVAQRRALIQEILSRYEDSLFGLSALFMLDGGVTRREFMRATSRLEERITGAQAFEWVPLVTDENRAAAEAALQRAFPQRNLEFIEFDLQGKPRRAGTRPFYFPITYIQPMRGNEAALGYDLVKGPTLPFLERARDTRQMVVTHQIRLIQETGDQRGVIMIWPVFRAARPNQSPSGDVFIGFLQCVFRVHDLLGTSRLRQPSTVLDMMWVDASETDAARRVLYYRGATDPATPATAPSEQEFKSGIYREQRIPFGGRDWRVIFRPDAQWLASHSTSTPFLRSGSILLLASLVAGLVSILARRNDTIRHQVEERTAELAESRRQHASMLHALPGMAYRGVYDEQLNVTFVSEGALALTGWGAEEFIAGAVHYRDCIHPEDLPRVREATRTALMEHSDVEIEYRVRTKEGAEKWVLSRGRGVYTADGKLHVFEGLVIDITAQKNAEHARLELERRLLEGQKLESLGLLAGGIAHDFNNLLSAILGNANLIRMTLPAAGQVEPQLHAIENASQRAAELCRQMLAYAGKGRFVVEPTDLTALAEDLLPLLNISIARQATLELDLARNLPPVLADATQLRQIVMNLVLNATDAIVAAGRQGQGTVHLTTGVMHATHEFLLSCVAGAGMARGDYVFIEVRDNGCGMTADVLAKIFDPFFTTKFAGRGLGLAAVLGIVRGHHGALKVESADKAGSTFRLLLPPARAAVAPARATETSASRPWRHDARLLLVDDEEPVRVVAAEMLKTFGLTVRTAPDGESALEIFRADPSVIDLVVLDLLMPGMGGERTLAELRAVRPQVAVLIVSGYSEGDILGRLKGEGPLAFLAKPFTRASIEAKLRELLEQ